MAKSAPKLVSIHPLSEIFDTVTYATNKQNTTMKKQEIDVIREITYNRQSLKIYLTVEFVVTKFSFRITGLRMDYDFVMTLDRDGKYSYKKITPDLKKAIDDFIESESLMSYEQDVLNFEYDEKGNPKYEVL